MAAVSPRWAGNELVMQRKKQDSPACYKPSGTPQHEHSPDSLECVVAHFIQRCRDGAMAELRFYRDQPGLSEAIEAAALARTKDGGRHSHQARIPLRILEQGKRRLVRCVSELSRSRTFDELFHVVDRARIRGLGELWAYDTAHRIGVYRGLEPTHVYLHRGTLEGAKALGLTHRRKILRIEKLPGAFRRLRPHEIEDCLCLYKERLRRLDGRQ